MENPKIQKELARIYIKNSYQLLSRFIGGDEEIQKITEGIKIHTDDKPFLEFSAPKAIYQKTMIPNLETLLKIFENAENSSLQVPKFLIGGGKAEILRYSNFFQNWLEAQIAFYRQDYQKAIYFYEEALRTGVYHPVVEQNLYLLKQ